MADVPLERRMRRSKGRNPLLASDLRLDFAACNILWHPDPRGRPGLAQNCDLASAVRPWRVLAGERTGPIQDSQTTRTGRLDPARIPWQGLSESPLGGP